MCFCFKPDLVAIINITNGFSVVIADISQPTMINNDCDTFDHISNILKNLIVLSFKIIDSTCIIGQLKKI